MFQFPLVVFFHSVESSWVSRQEFQSFFPVGIGNAISYGLNACKETKKAKPVAMGQILKKKISGKPKNTIVIFKVYVHWVYITLYLVAFFC
jgi:hypothetical protein